MSQPNRFHSQPMSVLSNVSPKQFKRARPDSTSAVAIEKTKVPTKK